MAKKRIKLKKKGVFNAVILSIYVLLTLASIVLLCIRGVSALKPVYILNIGADIMGMFVALVLSACGYVDYRGSGEYHRFYMSMVNVVFLGLFTDEIAWLVDALPRLRMVNLIDNSLFYLATTVVGYFFWRYVTSLLHVTEKKWIKRCTALMGICLIIALVMRVVNLFTGIYFTVNRDGVYERGTLFFAPMVFSVAVLMLAFIVIMQNREKLRLSQRVALILYVVMPFIVSVMTVSIYGLSVTFSVLVLVLVLMYGMVNIERGMKKAVIEKDLNMATRIQEGVLPREFPAFPDRKEFDLYASMDPAKEVGGDFYDFFLTDEDHLAVVVADVSGKGVPAALFMMVAKALLKNRLKNGDTPGQALYSVNNQLLKGGQELMFVTVWMAILEISTGKGVSVNAGHEHPILKHRGGSFEAVEYRHSVPVATMEDMRFREREFKLEKGDTLFVYTDGVPEAMNDAGKFYGVPGMLEGLNAMEAESPKEVVEGMQKRLEEFVGGAEQFDDITMLCLNYNGI